MSVTTRAEFDNCLRDLHNATQIVFDTETNGLKPYQGNRMISLSLYLPEFNRSYNLAFRNGQGEVKVDDETPFAELTWQKKAKKQQYLRYWYGKYKETMPVSLWGNLPIEWLDEIKHVWGLPHQVYIGHNTKFDLHMLAVEGFPTPYAIEDTMIWLHTLFSDWNKVRLNGFLANRQLKWQAKYWGIPGASDGEEQLETNVRAFENSLASYIAEFPDDPTNNRLFSAQRKNEGNAEYFDRRFLAIRSKLVLDRKANMWMMPADKVAFYAELDVRLTWALREKVRVALDKWSNNDLNRVMQDIQLEVAWAMERTGVYIDREQAHREIEKLTPDMTRIANEFKIASDKSDFNLNAWQQTLPFLKAHADPTISSTSTAILRNYKDNTWVSKLLHYRMLTKTVNTYLRSWLNAADNNGVVHPTFNVDGTATGRFSSGGDGGNWQNIPDRRGYTIKRAVVTPGEDWMFLAVDYSQLELRLAVWIAEVTLGYGHEMYDLFERDEDMHAYTRDMVGVCDVVFGGMSNEEILFTLGYTPETKPEEFADPAKAVGDYCRFIAKTMNFGLLYGGGKRMLSKLLNIDLDPAYELVERWNALFPAFRRANQYYQDLALEQRHAPNGGGVFQYTTQPISNRHRKYDKYSENLRIKDGKHWITINQKEQQARKAFNSVVQGLGGYLCAASALEIQRNMRYHDIKLFAQIHDALEFYIHRDSLSLIPEICKTMCDWSEITPKLKVAYQVSQQNWQDMTKVADLKLLVASRGYEGVT